MLCSFTVSKVGKSVENFYIIYPKIKMILLEVSSTFSSLFESEQTYNSANYFLTQAYFSNSSLHIVLKICFEFELTVLHANTRPHN